MIIDAIVHTTPDGKWFQTPYDASEIRLIDEMNAANVQKAVLVGLSGYINNDYILEAASRHAPHLIPCGAFNPTDHLSPKYAVSAVRKELVNMPFQAVKFHPRLNHYDPLDKRMLATLEEISSWNNPPMIWLDTLFYKRGIILQKSSINTIHTLINIFSSLTFMLLHGGGSTIFSLAEAIRDCPNAYIDISFTLNRYQGTSLPNDIRQLMAHFDQRIVFGSDFPEVSIPDAFMQTQNLLGDLPVDKAAAIMGDNLARIFNLEAA